MITKTCCGQRFQNFQVHLGNYRWNLLPFNHFFLKDSHHRGNNPFHYYIQSVSWLIPFHSGIHYSCWSDKYQDSDKFSVTVSSAVKANHNLILLSLAHSTEGDSFIVNMFQVFWWLCGQLIGWGGERPWRSVSLSFHSASCHSMPVWAGK